MANAMAVSGFTDQQLRVIRSTVAKDTNDTEFSLFMEACWSYRLDPFRKQIHAVVYSKDKPDKRKMSIIVSRDGLRVIAQRCADYRPASEPVEFTYDETLKGPLNPKGIVTARVRLWKQDKKGDWYAVSGEADWDEFAPVKEAWGENEQGKWKPTGRFEIEPGNWTKMPKVMIGKCAELQALRAGWPESFGGLYVEEEMDRVRVQEDAAERLHQYEREQRQAAIGGPGLMFVFDDAMVLNKVNMGEVHDKVCEFLAEATPQEAHVFYTRNAAALNEFWAHDKPAALDLKKRIAELEKRLHEPKQIEGRAA